MGGTCCSRLQPLKNSSDKWKEGERLPERLVPPRCIPDDKVLSSSPSSSSLLLTTSHKRTPPVSRVKRVYWKNTYEIVWLDDELFRCEKSHTLLEQAAASIMGYATPFKEIEQCKIYLEQPERNFFVIISGGLGEQFIRLIHDMHSVKYIFIFCLHIDYHKRWSKHFSKVQGCFDNSYLLFLSISECFHRSFIQQHSRLLRCPYRHLVRYYQPHPPLTTIFSPSDHEQLLSDSSVDMHKRYLSLILIDIILRMPCNEACLQDMQHVYDNLRRSRIQNMPEEYRSEHAIQLFIEHAPLQTYLAEIFRIENIVSLYGFRHFIIDLQEQILASERFHCPGLVYHGRTMSFVELNKLYENVDKLTSLNSFLLGTTVRAIGRAYALGSTDQYSRKSDQRALHAVLFEIEIDERQAFYHSDSCVLLPLGLIFKIKRVIEHENIHIARLAVVTDPHPDWNAFMTYYRTEIGSETSPLTLANILSQMNECTSAKYFYKICLTEHLCSKTSVYNNIGCMYYEQGNYSQAAKYMRKVCDMCLESAWLHLGILSATYNNLAMIDYKLGNFDQAREHCSKALTFKLSYQPIDDRSLATIYFNIGLIDHAREQFLSAHNYFMKTYAQQQIIRLPQYHPDVLRLTIAMAANYQRMNDIVPAYASFERALEIASNSLHPDHPYINRIQDHFNYLTPIRDHHVHQWMSTAQSQLPPIFAF